MSTEWEPGKQTSFRKDQLAGTSFFPGAGCRAAVGLTADK